jgi:hypothetical protein
MRSIAGSTQKRDFSGRRLKAGANCVFSRHSWAHPSLSKPSNSFELYLCGTAALQDRFTLRISRFAHKQRRVFRVLEVTETNSNQAKELTRSEVNAIEKRQGNISQSLCTSRHFRRRKTTGQGAEFLRLQLERNRARSPRILSVCCPDFLSQPAYRRLRFRQRNVFREGILSRDGFRTRLGMTGLWSLCTTFINHVLRHMRDFSLETY